MGSGTIINSDTSTDTRNLINSCTSTDVRSLSVSGSSGLASATNGILRVLWLGEVGR